MKAGDFVRRGRSHAPGAGAAAAAPSAGPSDPPPGRPASFAVRVRVSITPWTDTGFAREVRDVMRQVSLSDEVVLGSGNGVPLAERLLHERGYARARVIDARSSDEAIRRIAHWKVLRDQA